jgi:allantoicase
MRYLCVLLLVVATVCAVPELLPSNPPPEFTNGVDLLAKRVGGKVISVSDQFFAEADNLMKSESPVFQPKTFTDHGQLMDGWETRRHNSNEFDWVILKLGLVGTIHGVMIDTAHFTGNHGPAASLEAISVEGEPSANELENSDQVGFLIFEINIYSG